jgi:hypothetical protein
LALGLCFSVGVVAGLAWITVHIALAIAALYVIERAATDLRAHVTASHQPGQPSRSADAGTAG